MNDSFFTSHSIYSRNKDVSLKQLDIRVGLFKANPQLIHHNIISTILTGQPAVLQYQFHGKRQRRTISLNTNLSQKYAWPFIERLLNFIIPKMYDLKTIKHKRSVSPISSYSLRLRERMSIVDEIDDLIEPFMLDTHKGIFFPFTMHFKLSNKVSHNKGETLIRCFRLPIHFYKRHKKPAFDDTLKISIEESFGIKLIK